MWRNNNCDKNSEISIVVVGDSQSGKTQLINKFQNFQFSKVYNPTGFNKIEKFVKQNKDDEMKVTVWDTSGLPSYSSLRPLVYRESSVVLVCYTTQGMPRVDSWVSEVRRSARVPVVLAHTRNDEWGVEDMRETCEMCERLGSAGWETTSALTGENVSTVFDLCISATRAEKPVIKTERLARPNSLKLCLSSGKTEAKTWARAVTDQCYADHVYENPEKISDSLTKSRNPKLERDGLQRGNNNSKFVIKRQFSISPVSMISREGGDTRNLCLRTEVDQSVFSPQSSKSCLKSPYSPTPSELASNVPMRPHSSQSACVRPSRLYRQSGSHRLSFQAHRLKPVSIPLSPNCDMARYGHSQAPAILSPTDSTVSSLISIPVYPGYRSQSDTSSVSALQPGYSDRDSVSSVSIANIKVVHSRTQDRKKELCSIM